MADPPPRGRALVTGASSGIGRAFALDLAHRGYQVLAAARRAERLGRLADEIAESGRGAIAPVAADLSCESGLATCRAAVGEGVDVAVLNAGFGSFGPLHAADRVAQADMVRVNCVAVADLAAAVLPGMVDRGRGALIVVSSAAALQPLPLMATYAASKSFELALVEAIAQELHGSGVRAIAVLPGPVHTEFGRVAGASPGPLPVPYSSIDAVVAATWRGLRRGRTRVGVGPVAHAAALAATIVPDALAAPLIGTIQRLRLTPDR